MDNFIIVGAGFAGLCTAIYFKLNDIQFNIFESKKADLKLGGSVTIFPNGMKILREIGVADKVISLGACMRFARFCNQNGDLIGHYSMGNKETYGEPTITIQRSVLHSIILEKARSIGVSINFEKKLISLSQKENFVDVEFCDNLLTKAKYVIGADGIHSTVRNYVTSKKTYPAYSNQIYVGGFISDKNTIDSFKLDTSTQYISVGPNSFFAYSIVDNTKQKEYNLLWYCYLHKRNHVSRHALRMISDEEILSEVTKVHENWHQPISNLISNSQKIVKTNIYDILGIEKWSDNRILIIGDSSHAINPISGQGASFAMEDAQMLTFLLKHKNESTTNVFKQLERIRKKRITPVAKKARRSTRLSSIKTTPRVQYIRDKLLGIKLKFTPERFYNRTLRYNFSEK